MYCLRKINEDLTYVGASEHRLSMFEGYYPVPSGMSYNSYLLTDEKNVLFDTVDASVCGRFLENVECVLNGGTLDYLVVHHMEPDHSASVGEILKMYPDVKIVCSQKAASMLESFLGSAPDNEIITVKENDTLCVGKHTLRFITAAMVHWPEVIMTYDETDKILFSADAFGSFGALDGAVSDEEKSFDVDEGRRYYVNIVGKYGAQVGAVLKKAANLEIDRICPLHGVTLKKSIADVLALYSRWASYQSEEKGVVIAYASVYGNTLNAAEILAANLREKGVKVKMYDVSVTHTSYIVADAFKYSGLVLASPTYNAGIFVTMDNLIRELVSHNIQNKRIGIIENGSWAATSAKQMTAMFEKSKNITFASECVTIKSAVNDEDVRNIKKLAGALAEDN